MVKFFRFNSRQRTPVARAELQKYCLFNFLGLFAFAGIALGIQSLGFINRQEVLFLLLILVFFSAIALQDLLIERFLDIFPDSKISAMAFSLYTMFPITNLPILYFCLTKKSGSPSPYWLPLIAKKRYSVILFVLMFFQQILFATGLYGGGSIRTHAWLNTPTNQKIAYVSYQAREIFRIKGAHSVKSNIMREIERSQKEVPFDSTGHVLSVAVVASDVFKKKINESQRSPATASREAALELLDNILHLHRLQKQHVLPWYGYSPLVLLSTENMLEVVLLLLVENEINHVYRVAMRKNLGELIATFEKVAVKENYGDDYLKKIAFYKSEIQKI